MQIPTFERPTTAKGFNRQRRSNDAVKESDHQVNPDENEFGDTDPFDQQIQPSINKRTRTAGHGRRRRPTNTAT